MTGRHANSHHGRGFASPAALLLGLAVAACAPDYSPNTYNTSAVQQANKAEQGVVVGVRNVDVKASGSTGAVVGGAAGGIAGAQVGTGTASAFGALGGSLVGGLIGTGVEHAAGDTTAYEYIVRKANKELVSVTQKDDPPLAIGQHVLVIAGAQARIVPDYTVTVPPEAPEVAKDSAHPAGHDAGPVPPAAGGPAEPAPGGSPPATGVSPAGSADNPAAAPAASPATGALPPPTSLVPAPTTPPVSAPVPDTAATARPATLGT